MITYSYSTFDRSAGALSALRNLSYEPRLCAPTALSHSHSRENTHARADMYRPEHTPRTYARTPPTATKVLIRRRPTKRFGWPHRPSKPPSKIAPTSSTNTGYADHIDTDTPPLFFKLNLLVLRASLRPPSRGAMMSSLDVGRVTSCHGMSLQNQL